MDVKLKSILNYATWTILILVIVTLIYYSIGEQKNQNYKYNQNVGGINFYSDQNIIQKLIEFNDQNKLYLISYSDQKNMLYITGLKVFFAQIIAGSGKTNSSYTFNQNKECIIYDKDINLVGTRDIDTCKAMLNSNNYKIQMKVDSKLNQSVAYIDKNTITIYSNSNESMQKDLRDLLKIFIPNLEQIESSIVNYIDKVSTSKQLIK